MRNRMKELREARGWSFDDLAQRVGEKVQGSTMFKLETGQMRMTTEWMERLGHAFGVHPVEIVDDRPATGLREEALPITNSHELPQTARTGAKAGHAFYRVTSNALDELSVLQGDLAEVDESPEARADLVTGDMLVCNVTDPATHVATTVLRQFIEPGLLITNSRHDNAMPINLRSSDVTIVGVVVGLHRQTVRRR